MLALTDINAINFKKRHDYVKRVNFQFQFDKIKSGHVLIYAEYISRAKNTYFAPKHKRQAYFQIAPAIVCYQACKNLSNDTDEINLTRL